MKRILLYLVVFLAAAMLPAGAIAQSLTWHTDQIILSNSYDAGAPSVAVSGDNAVAVWKHSTAGHDDIYASYSTNKGQNWSTPVTVDYNTLAAQEPQVAISGSNVVVVFRQMEGGWQRIFANYSNDGGATWGGARLIEDNAGYNGYEPQVVVSGSNVVAIWRQYDGSRDRIYSSSSANGGQTWSADAIIDGRAQAARMPHLAVSGNNVVAIWSQYDGAQHSIYTQYSTNGGVSWSASDAVIEDIAYDGAYPRVAVSGNNVVAIWTVWDTTGRVYANRAAFSSGVLTWTPANRQLVQNNDALDADGPQVAISGENVVAVWNAYEDVSGGIYHLYTSSSSNAGTSWNASQLLVANGTISAGSPRVAISGSNVVAVWSQDESSYRIYARHSFNGGSSWSTPGLIEDNAGGNGGSPQVVISGNNVVAVWNQINSGYYGVFANYATLTAAATKDDGSNCFIATAAFGSPLSGQVEILRQFRDKYLLTNVLGQKFVSWYYENGPVAASFIDDKPFLKAAVRAALYPLIGFSFLLINGFMPFVMMGLLGLAAILFFQFRPKKLNAR